MNPRRARAKTGSLPPGANACSAKGAVKNTLTEGTRDERHAVRIAAKKVRYAAEFFAPFFRQKRTRTYVKALAKLQDVLGQFNDGAIAARLASELLGHDPAAGVVHGWVAAQAAAREPELVKAQQRFDKAKCFWI
jgi:CHAD domain-containing protein